MYIALEGIKGSGKTTLIKNILKAMPEQRHALCRTTAPVHSTDPLERLLVKKPELKNHDCFMEQLFLHRAQVHDSGLSQQGIILGDRSILTAYVTRWNKWNDPLYTIRRIKEQYKNIRTPDVYILLELPVETSLKHIESRKAKPTGTADERKEALQLADTIYRHLLIDGEYQRKIGKTQTIRVNAGMDITSTSEEIIKILKHYKKTK
jgi:thymidylate kinase